MTSHEGRVCAETQMHAGGLCIVTQSRTWKAAATSQRNSSLQAGPSSVTPNGSAGDALPVDSRCRRRAAAQGSGSAAGACPPSTAEKRQQGHTVSEGQMLKNPALAPRQTRDTGPFLSG